MGFFFAGVSNKSNGEMSIYIHGMTRVCVVSCMCTDGQSQFRPKLRKLLDAAWQKSGLFTLLAPQYVEARFPKLGLAARVIFGHIWSY